MHPPPGTNSHLKRWRAPKGKDRLPYPVLGWCCDNGKGSSSNHQFSGASCFRGAEFIFKQHQHPFWVGILDHVTSRQNSPRCLCTKIQSSNPTTGFWLHPQKPTRHWKNVRLEDEFLFQMGAEKIFFKNKISPKIKKNIYNSQKKTPFQNEWVSGSIFVLLGQRHCSDEPLEHFPHCSLPPLPVTVANEGL